MKISVAMATYNGAKYLPEQLASIAGQTRPPDELYVSDDGSSDGTLDLVSAFATSVDFPVVVERRPERLGFADNFLSAGESCSGGIVAFCDQDDVWLPRKLELGCRRILEDGSLLSMHTLTVADANLRPTGFELRQGIFGDIVKEPLSVTPFGTGWGNTMMLRREVLKLVPRKERPAQPFTPDRSLSHDTWVYALAAALGRVSYIDAPLVLYRQHGATATGDARPPSRNHLLKSLNVPIAEYQERRGFDAQMAFLLARLSDGGSVYAEAARRAVTHLSERCDLWDARIKCLSGATFRDRLDGYRRHSSLIGSERNWLGSRLKDLLLGVSGIARRVNSASESRIL